MLTSPATIWLILMGIIYSALMIALPALAAEKSESNWDWQVENGNH